MSSMINLLYEFRRDLYREKLYDGYGKATEVDIKHWEQVVASMNRRIAYVKQLDDEFILKGDYNEVDWLAMANISFRNTRTARQLRLKWLNEQCPEWSKDEWSYAEIEHLKKYAEDSTRIKAVNWEIVADELDTDRTPLQCFARVQEMKQYMLDRCSWTKEEDLKLRTMKIIAQNLGAVRWGRGIVIIFTYF
ncbi:unnamed protein product [Anisakis simplex]|uniref:snRNA-activating protein complex subunit 4 (inferred by orthology to a human protein) n=1 Tax=Anisakis simplex TaxID=6269 RepID=A0A0M3KJD3_ANISI|nr:unnamed protein product [Anisakis simplex]